MILPSSSSEWDYEWDYTMGMPSADDWSHVTSGTSTTTIESTGLKLTNSSSSGWNTFYFKRFGASTAVFEIKMKVKYRATNAGGFGIVTLHNSGSSTGNSISVAFSTKSATSGKIYLPTVSTWDEGTQIGTFSSDVYKVVRIELDNNVGRVYLNGVLAADNIDPTQLHGYQGDTVFSAYHFKEGGTYHYLMIEYIKIKLGRL